MTKLNPFDWKYERGVTELIDLADINFLVCQRIYELIERKGVGYYFLLLAANNSFNESVGIIHTLLCSTKEEEFCIGPLLELEIEKRKAPVVNVDTKKSLEFLRQIEKDYPSPNYLAYTFLNIDDDRYFTEIIEDIKTQKIVNDGMSDLKKLKDRFMKLNFHIIRHQTTAHKNKNLSSPAGSATLMLKKGMIDNLGEIVKNLKINNLIWFNHALSNSFYSNLSSLDDLVRICSLEVDK